MAMMRGKAMSEMESVYLCKHNIMMILFPRKDWYISSRLTGRYPIFLQP